MSNYAKRPRRILAGMLAGAMALSVTPILGFTGVASAADPLPPIAEPIGDGNFCENVDGGEPFTDVNGPTEEGPDDPSWDEIVCLVATEITTGVTATTYEPNAPITRRQMALFLKRVADLANRLEIGGAIEELPEASDTPAYPDVAPEEEFIRDAISQISQAGIAEGFPDDTYRPRAHVSRRQMANFIERLYEFLTGEALPGPDGDYFDDDNGDSGEPALNATAGAGIFQGDGEGNVRPAGTLTRRQMANVLLRFLQVLVEEGEITTWEEDDDTTGNQTATSRPELVSATIVQTTTQGTTVRYTFDEALTGVGVVPGLFHVYTFGSTGTPADSGDTAQVDNANTSSVLVTFGAITTASTLGPQLSVGTVDEGAVRGITGAATDDNIIGDAPLNAGTTSQLVAGQTGAPDLLSVGNFRPNPGNSTQTLVDFTFDEAATTQFGGSGYELVSINGVDSNDSSIIADAVIAGDGTTVHTVAFDNNAFIFPNSTVTIAPASIARGTVWQGTVEDAAGNPNPLQSADVSNGGNSETPDLVSAIAVRNQEAPAPAPPGTMIDAILYTFDEPVINPDSLDFCAYMSTGAEICPDIQAVRSTSNDTQVAVVFGPAGTLNDVVGASVYPTAVIEGSGGQDRPNLQDEVPIANVGTGASTTSGRTAGPDLIGVAVDERRDPFGTLVGGRVTYSFDEDIVDLDSTQLNIVLADGTQYTCSGGATVGITEDTDHMIRCDVFGAATTTQILAAVVGTVDNGAVNNQTSGTNPGVAGGETNPEGAEIAT